MVTMIDEIYDRDYQSGRAELNSALIAGLVRLGRAFGNAFGNAFAVLNRIEYSAPWSVRPRKARSH
jgi:hypothetical protein